MRLVTYSRLICFRRHTTWSPWRFSRGRLSAIYAECQRHILEIATRWIVVCVVAKVTYLHHNPQRRGEYLDNTAFRRQHCIPTCFQLITDDRIVPCEICHQHFGSALEVVLVKHPEG